RTTSDMAARVADAAFAGKRGVLAAARPNTRSAPTRRGLARSTRPRAEAISASGGGGGLLVEGEGHARRVARRRVAVDHTLARGLADRLQGEREVLLGAVEIATLEGLAQPLHVRAHGGQVEQVTLAPL